MTSTTFTQPATNKPAPSGPAVAGAAFDRLVSKLDGVRQRGDGRAVARCPAHDDRNPSLSVTRIEGQVLLHCFAGCDAADVVAALSLSLRDLYDDSAGAAYRYDDGRMVHRGLDLSDIPRKTFKQSGNTKGGALYRLERVTAAVAAGQVVVVVEGEKDVHAVESLGYTATSNAMGAGKAHKADWTPLRGATVAIVADRDEPGIKHAEQVRDILAGLGCTVTVWQAKTGKDISDHIAAGHGLPDLVTVEPDELDKPETPTRRLKLTPASTIKPRPVRWLWETADGEGRLPTGSLTLAVGRAGVGKSQFAAWLTARITTGNLPGVLWQAPRSVIYSASEDSWEMTIVPRLMAAGANLDRVFRIDVTDDEEAHARLTLPSDISLLEHAINDHQVGLVVCDPLLSLIDGGLNDYRAREVRQALEPLGTMADKTTTKATILGLAHFTKASGSDPLNLVSGSAAFGQIIRGALAFAKEDRDDDQDETEQFQQPGNGQGVKYVMSTIKNSVGREDLPSLEYSIEPYSIDTPEGESKVSRLEFVGTSKRSVKDIISEFPARPKNTTDRDEAKEFLRDLLDGRDVPVKDIKKEAQDAGHTWMTIRRAADDLGARKVKRGKPGEDGQHWVWTLTPEGAHEDAEDAHTRTGEHLRGSVSTFGSQGSQGSGVRDSRSLAPLGAPLACRACGEPLDPVHADTGTHPTCDPSAYPN
ncbi:hypothetical protein EF847_00085 [Actinobacteria bacterium YIM 96077]|uniref:Toprim domain-containing protein n=1 Tax=Phytoactinopolyspora halophila TaxID=1981511 RepID=A0A329QQQ5_9ACTN|nr:AAA family ATPase [Phytoactinopolyspora halophila]AYY11354.1 hypothetical protein EF847_00085 [Actinobacteria bacterium YIM 96077]RAW14697.1 hypothetical protein DPM12_10585 [Phytoactinopolyspora halophila]